MRIANFIFAVMFLVFAFVQVNDPDPVIWILIYGSMAVVCILAIFELYLRPVIIGLLIIFSAYGLIFIPGVFEWLTNDNRALLFDDLAKMQYPYIEEAREFLGLSICIAILVAFLVRSNRRRSQLKGQA
jgi:hypothetical protein